MKRTIIGIILVALVLMVGAASAFGENGTVTVSAQANSKLTLTLDKLAVDFGMVDPGSVQNPAGSDVVVTVSSNKPYDISSVVNDPAGATQMGLANTLVDAVDEPKTPPAGQAYTDDLSINVPWDTTPDVPLSASVVYTAVQ